jgi:hypothetical protein
MNRPTPNPPDHESDTVSDPAKGDADGSDWSDEGGATPDGPAGDIDAS